MTTNVPYGRRKRSPSKCSPSHPPRPTAPSPKLSLSFLPLASQVANKLSSEAAPLAVHGAHLRTREGTAAGGRSVQWQVAGNFAICWNEEEKEVGKNGKVRLSQESVSEAAWSPLLHYVRWIKTSLSHFKWALDQLWESVCKQTPEQMQG